jgi:large subunit ribosomal protein L25
MARNYSLKSEIRDRAGKGVARALRREQKVPGVIYGDGKEPINITLPEKEVTLEYRKGQMFTTLCDMEAGEEKHLVLARDVQVHPVNDKLLHVDFLRVSPRTKIAVMVPVQIVNEEQSPGLQEGGILNVIRYEIELVCRATNMPDFIEVDVSKYEIGDSVKMSDITLPESTEAAISDRDFNIAMIAAPKTVEEIEEDLEEGEEGAEGAEGEEGAEGAESSDSEGEEKAEDKGES